MILYKVRENMLKQELKTGKRQTYATIAQGVGTNASTIAKLASPNIVYNPSMRLIEKLARYFECDIGDLVTIHPDADAA